MCKKLICSCSLVLVLSLASCLSAALPPGWRNQDIGSSTGGSAEESAGTWTVNGNGSDIWGSADAFHFVYQNLEGDGEISGRIINFGSGSNNWAKVGVMIRETLDPGSKHAMTVVTAGEGGGAALQWRPETGGESSSQQDPSPAVTPPYWVKIAREGNQFTGYLSPDGIEWMQQGETQAIDMAEIVLIGLCLTSHVAGEIRTAEIDNLKYVGNVHGYIKSYNPVPADGGIYPETWATLQWSAGYTAASHDIYFGENFADVNDGTGGTFRGNQPSLYFVVGFPSFPYPDGLVLGTTYYWRVDEVEADNITKHKGDVWRFTVPSKKAYAPNPADGAKFIDPEASLSWTPGFGAKLHTVYFGDDFDVVSNATGGASIGATNYAPGSLELEKTYYWRIDEFDGATTYKGDVWSFTTTGTGGGLRGDYYKGMDFDNHVLSRLDPQINFNWGENEPDPLVNADYFSVRWTGTVEAVFTETYTFYTLSDDGVRLWVAGQLLIDNWTDHEATENMKTIELVAGQAYSIVMEFYENGGEAVAELRWSSPSTPKQLIPQGALSPPVKASSPNPLNGAIDVKTTPILSWIPGDYASSHEVYFGTDKDAVNNATTDSPEYKGVKELGDESYDPDKLTWATTYYWRIDEVNNAHPVSPWVGNLWSFTTGNFLAVDDFEDYDAGDNQIWYAWLDGLGYGVPGTADYFAGNGTGASIGDETTVSFTEETIVHSGNQSMPYSYDNNKQGFANYSEAELTLSYPRDWTEGDVGELSLWYRGYPASVGSFTEGPAGTYTMTAAGADIWAVNGVEADEFHFAYKTLSGPGSIVAKVESVSNTNGWAKAGVMIRETLNADSKHAMMVVTPTQGISSQRRHETGGTSAATTTIGIASPHWVKIERNLSGDFTAYHSSDGSTWQIQGATENIPMAANIHIGLALTAHDISRTCEAKFTNVTFTGTVGQEWMNQDIGILSNDPEPLYVAVSNITGQPAIVIHDDPTAAQIDTWTEWVIPLQTFADQGINLTDIDRIAIGLGTKGNMTIPGGSGNMFFDDIRLYQQQDTLEE